MVIVFNSIYRKFVSVEMYVLYRINGILFSVFNLLIDIFQGVVFNVIFELNFF